MNCRIVRSKISEYVDQELSGREMLELRQHSDRCEACAKELERELKLKVMLGSLKGAEPMVGFESRLIDAVLAQSETVNPPIQMPWRNVFLAAAAGAAVVFGVLRVIDRGPVDSYATNSPNTIDLTTDQAIQGSQDPFGGAPIITVSNGSR